jgi:hypothetical protein
MKKNKDVPSTKANATGMKPANEAAAGVPVAGTLEAFEAGAAGALAGAVVGAIAGPPGAIIGAILGASAGAGAEIVGAKDKAEKRAHNAELDREIGVFGGHIGEASPDAPKARRGTFSAASSGASSGGSTPSEGPMPKGDA